MDLLVSFFRDFVLKQLVIVPIDLTEAKKKENAFLSEPNETISLESLKIVEPTEKTSIEIANENARGFGKLDPSSKFCVKKDFLKVLQSLEEAKEMEVFTYVQVRILKFELWKCERL